MACSGNYDDDKDSDPSDEEKQKHRKLLTALRDALGVDFEKAFQEKAHSLEVNEFFAWIPAETTVVVIGIGKGIESEFAFQHYLNLYGDRGWIVIVAHAMKRVSFTKTDKKTKLRLEREELRTKYRNIFETHKLHGAFYAAECDRPETLIVLGAMRFKASYIVLGRKRTQNPFAHSLSKRVLKDKPAGCEVLRFKILEGWKAGEPTISEKKSKRGQLMLPATSQSKSPLGPHSPLGPSEAAASMQLVPSPEALPPDRLLSKSTSDSRGLLLPPPLLPKRPSPKPAPDSKRWELPPPAQESVPPKRESTSKESSTNVQLCSSEEEEKLDSSPSGRANLGLQLESPSTSESDSAEAELDSETTSQPDTEEPELRFVMNHF